MPQLVALDLADRTLTSIRDDVECPSPRRIFPGSPFKQHGDLPPGQWRLAVLDLRTGQRAELAEQHNVDDQPEWLDDQHACTAFAGASTP